MEHMPRHPDNNAAGAGGGGGHGVPGGLELDNSLTGDAGYRYVDGLPIRSKDTPQLSAFLNAKLALVTHFHTGPAPPQPPAAPAAAPLNP